MLKYPAQTAFYARSENGTTGSIVSAFEKLPSDSSFIIADDLKMLVRGSI